MYSCLYKSWSTTKASLPSAKQQLGSFAGYHHGINRGNHIDRLTLFELDVWVAPGFDFELYSVEGISLSLSQQNEAAEIHLNHPRELFLSRYCLQFFIYLMLCSVTNRVELLWNQRKMKWYYYLSLVLFKIYINWSHVHTDCYLKCYVKDMKSVLLVK